jgi:hypothetical protein
LCPDFIIAEFPEIISRNSAMMNSMTSPEKSGNQVGRPGIPAESLAKVDDLLIRGVKPAEVVVQTGVKLDKVYERRRILLATGKITLAQGGQ